ncbi:protein S100-A10b [Cynoglossus semilaevis]|nr:protein S100-A1-like [Cynoglossus semilaevis]
MTDMEIGMETLIKVFHRYATKDGNGKSLNKKGLRTLLENEVPTFLKSQDDPNIVDRIMKDLDEDRVDRLKFEQFFSFIAGLSIACEKLYVCKEQVKK